MDNYVKSLLVLQNFTTARKSGNILLTYLNLFSSDTHQSKKMTFSYSDKYRTKEAFKYVKRMLPLFRAVVNG